jgi:type IV secretion system protein VirB9
LGFARLLETGAARANDPFAKLGKQQIAIDVSSVIRASPSSFRVEWVEHRYQDGALADNTRWTAIITIAIQTPTSADVLRKNPLGIYVTAIINTDRRTYLLELRSTEKTYMASVSWQYPEDQLIALRRQNQEADAAAPIASGVDLASINFRYAIQGDNPAWRPLRAFDDGHKVYIEFPSGIAQGEMPPPFVIGPAGGSEFVNYRVNRNYYIVDRLFAAAKLRLGEKDSERRVRIVRTDGRPRS